jgi:hypothetical protein
VAVLTIATWNLERTRPGAHERIRVFLEQMAEIEADIWVLTETSEAIRPARYSYLASSPWPGAPYEPDERGVMIWSRRPLRQVQTLPFLPKAGEPAAQPSYALTSQDTAPVACALAETPVGPILVYGTIITWPGDPGPQGGMASGAAQRQAIDAQAADWTSLRATLRDVPLFVVGDLNVSLAGPVYPSRELREHLSGALGQAGLRCLTGEFVAPEGKPAVDQICLGGPLAVRRFEADLFTPRANPASPAGHPVSDHPGLWGRFYT